MSTTDLIIIFIVGLIVMGIGWHFWRDL